MPCRKQGSASKTSRFLYFGRRNFALATGGLPPSAVCRPIPQALTAFFI